MSNPVQHLVLWRAIVAYPMPAQEKAVLTCLCSYGNSDGTHVFPSQRTLAMLNDMSLREMRRNMHSIKEKGFLIGDGWKNRCKQWRINTELFLAAPPVQAEKPKKEKKTPVVVVPDVGASEPPKLTPEQIAKRHADKERVLAQLQRR